MAKDTLSDRMRRRKPIKVSGVKAGCDLKPIAMLMSLPGCPLPGAGLPGKPGAKASACAKTPTHESIFQSKAVGSKDGDNIPDLLQRNPGESEYPCLD